MFYDWEKVDKNQVMILLRELKELFASPRHWIYCPKAINISQIETSPLSSEAISWSLLGACDMLTAKHYEEPLASFVGCATRDYLNDLSDEKLIHGALGYEDEVALIDFAIEYLDKV